MTKHSKIRKIQHQTVEVSNIFVMIQGTSDEIPKNSCEEVNEEEAFTQSRTNLGK